MTARIALYLDGGSGRRVARVLLAEPNVEVGLFGADPADSNTNTVSTFEGWDALAVDAITDATRTAVGAALLRGVPVVVGSDLPNRYDVGEGTFVAGVFGGPGLAAALASSMIGSDDRPVEARLAWTVPGRLLGAGIPITFPEPVGPLWAGRAQSPLLWPSAIGLAAPDDTPWRAVSVYLKSSDQDGETDRTYGVADDSAFLDGVCMGAAALAAARGAYPAGLNGPGDPDGLFMRLARRAGLELAGFVAG